MSKTDKSGCLGCLIILGALGLISLVTYYSRYLKTAGIIVGIVATISFALWLAIKYRSKNKKKIWYANLIREGGGTDTKFFSSKAEFYNWYNKVENWEGTKEIELVEGKYRRTEISTLGSKTSGDMLSLLIRTIKEFKPEWEVRSDRFHQGKVRSLIGEEKGTSRNLSDFLVRKNWASKVEVTIPGYGRADILVEDRYIIEAKVHIAEPGPRRDLGSKARRLRETKYQLVIVIYMGYLPQYLSELRRELGGISTEIIPLSNWHENFYK